MTTEIEPFSIHFTDKDIMDLHRRLDMVRFPDVQDEAEWQHGTAVGYLQRLVTHWRDHYDWQPKEAELNQWPQFTCKVDDVIIHFFHIKSQRPNAVPLLLTHGWPDSFLRYAKVFPMLRDFNLIVPSLPGFAFSTLPRKGFLNNAEIAELWYRLMTDVLGYRRFVASGGDVGRGVTHFLAQNHPEAVMGIHLTDVGFARELLAAADWDLTDDEQDYKHRAAQWMQMEGAYIKIQSTKPQTLAYALADSPVALAAWMAEKYHAWSDWELFSMDDLLDCLTLYWLTNSACTSIRVYHANAFTLPPQKELTVPMAFAHFKYDVLPVPRRWIERHYPVVQYDEIPRGGHFTALEQPEAFAESIKAFAERL